jgi:DNA adenine methylase
MKDTQENLETSPDMKITALAPWFGGKRTLAPVIVEELGKHSAYWEPFCGSMAVLLAKPPCSMETVNDLHADLINLARIVRDRTYGPILYRRLRRIMMSQEIHQYAAKFLSDKPCEGDAIERAEAFFIGSWMCRNGVAGSRIYNYGFCARYTKNGGHAAKRFCGAVESIPAWRRRMRAINILSMDAFELLGRIEDAPGVVIYCDPPYLEKGAKYVHDFDSWDHHKLALALKRFAKTRVIVSYYEHPRLAELYPGWTKRQIVVTKAMASQGARDAANDIKATEVLLINGPSLAGGAA